jgi:CHAT domain-containing protein/Flp pilus assembly protein TadD
MGFKFISTKRSSLMKQRVLRLGLLIGLFLAAGMVVLPGVDQVLPVVPNLENRGLAEAKRLNQQAINLYKDGKYEEAIILIKKVLIIREKLQGKDHPDVAISLNNLADSYRSQGKYTEATPLFQRSLAIFEKAFGNNNPNVALSLNNLAILHRSQGKYAKAEQLLRRSLSIFEKSLGKDDPDVARSLNNLADLYVSQGKYTEAEKLLRRSLSIFEKSLGKDDPDVALSLNNLANLYLNQGKYADAKPLFQRSLVIRERALGREHLDVSQSLNNLATLYVRQYNYVDAEPLLQRSLAICEKVLGKNHPIVALSLNNLAALYSDGQEKYYKAEPLLQRSLVIRERSLGREHPDVAQSLSNLASLYSSQQKYVEAELLYQRSLAILEKAMGKDHPDVAINLGNLSSLYDSQGKYSQAVAFREQSSVIQEKRLLQILVNGSEQDKKDYVDNILDSPNSSITLAIKSNRPDALKLAATNVLRRQGRILDATAAIIQRVRTQLKNRPDLQKLFDDLRTTFQEQSALANNKLNETNPPAYKARYQELKKRRQELESQLNDQSAVFRQSIAPVELTKVQALVPLGAVLVHIVRYQPYDSLRGIKSRFGLPRYAAAILRSTGDPHWVDLGAAAEIEKNIQIFRAYLQDGSGTNNIQRNKIARTLDAQLIQPLRQHLGNTKHLLLSPDGALNLIPFEALKDENDKYLIERYAFSYLTSGRDLTRFVDSLPSRQAPVIFSSINYDRSTNLSPLATDAETQAIQSLFPNTQVFRDRAATKTALQKVQAPQILHLATHGFFTPNNPNTPQQLDKPLTQSGIALAGKDQLTGLEAYGLDLYGTQLVVLSACETGVGDISVGEGIYGLRRALVIAGSQSQVLSLWKVGDRATVELMKTFYANLKAGMGRHEALRQAQLKLLQHPNYQNPFYWAAFIPSGNWEPLQMTSIGQSSKLSTKTP